MEECKEFEKWMRNHPGRAITTYQIASILISAFSASAPANAIESFKTTGFTTAHLILTFLEMKKMFWSVL